MSIAIWFYSLRWIPSRSNNVVANGIIIFFLWVINISLYIPHIFFIPLSTDRHLDCSHMLSIANNTAVSTGVCISFGITVFLFSGLIWEVESLNQFRFLIFEESSNYFPWSLHQITILPQNTSVLVTFLLTLVISCHFYNSHSDICEVISCHGFDLHFPDD